MTVDKDEVLRIAKLAALALTETELERYRGDLAAILEYVSQIQQVEVVAASEDLDPSQTGNVLREDIVRPGLSREQALSNAGDTDGQYFRVPPAIPES